MSILQPNRFADETHSDRSWTEGTCSKVCRLLYEELRLPQGAPGGAEDYRNCLVTSLFFRFFTRVADCVKKASFIRVKDTVRILVQVFEIPCFLCFCFLFFVPLWLIV